jgi:selenocysteine-specific elongation factor
MAIIGTAGHVDHGKSTLVLALTGRDPDRWQEEKQRGLTIDLGFAWTEIGGHQVGFVDVPGHERFIKNMLAGVGALTVGCFVVAADEGWMPQTEEHLSVLDLLDTAHGVIALTKIDAADPEMAELAQLDIAERIEGTTLAGWPVVPVSAVSGEGMDELRVALAAALDAAGPPRDIGRPRLWIDRSFTIAGAGVVVTGTLVGGKLRDGDTLELWPGPRQVRVRGLQSHETSRTEIGPGTRTAVNLTGADLAAIPRGAMLAAPGDFAATGVALASLRRVRGLEDALAPRGAYHAHVGTGAWPVKIRMLDAQTGEDSVAALVRFEGELPLVAGDRFVLRETGRRAVVAGGKVLDPAPASQRADRLATAVPRLVAAVTESADDRADALLEVRHLADIDELRRLSGGGRATPHLATDSWALTAEATERIADEVERRLGRFHTTNPLRTGESKAAVASSTGIDVEVLEAVVASDGRLVDDGATLRLNDFEGGWGERQEGEWSRAADALRGDGLAVRRISQLGLDAETLHAVLRDGRLVRVADDVGYLPEQIEELLGRLTAMEDGFTVAEFRDAMGISRRQAVPILEWLDAGGWTSRRGDVRTVRRRSSPGPDDAPSR